ncbi:MAG: hypothetical protein QM765_53285 [Myxococcales bacterium]
MKVLAIPEDQEVDQYIVKPVLEALFDDLGVKARVSVLPEPRLRGSSQALDPEMIRSIVDDNPMEDLFVLLVDRDCNRERNVERALARQAEHSERLITCIAIQEIEVWMLALHTEHLDARWNEIRAHCDPKEAWADPLLAKIGGDSLGRGRKRAMRSLAGNWRSLKSRCQELQELQEAIGRFVAARQGG